MRHLQLIDVVVSIPDDIVVTDEPAVDCCTVHVLEGIGAAAISEIIEQEAAARGYSVSQRRIGTFLRRGEQRIDLASASPDRLLVRVDDAEQLPLAGTTPNGVRIGAVAIPIDAAKIVPGRERCDVASRSCTSEWLLEGADPTGVAHAIHDRFVDLGLRPGAVFVPGAPEGGLWTVEASNEATLLRAYVNRTDQGFKLEVTIVGDDPGRATSARVTTSKPHEGAHQGNRGRGEDE